MNYEEDRIQASIVQALSLLRIYFFYVPNSEAGATSPAKGARMKAMGLRAGVSDLIIMAPGGKGYGLEVKTSTGVLSDKQKEFRAKCEELGWPYAVARSVDEAVAIVKKWGIA